MSEGFDLLYSDEALLSRVIFLSSTESISVFVEDEYKEYEYEEIFENLLDSNVKISCIFPTGGKPKLEEAYDLFGKSNEYGKTFFIADGDFDSALEKKMICADNFLYLKKYNIESYLLNKSAIIKFMRPRLKKTIKETERIVNLDEWIVNIDSFFKCLYKKQEKLIFVCSPNHPIAKQKNISPKELFSYDFAVTEKIGFCYNKLTHLATEYGENIKEIVELDSTEVLSELVVKGCGIAFLPEYCVKEKIAKGLLIKIDVNIDEQIYYSQILCHKNRWISPYIKAFVETLEETN